MRVLKWNPRPQLPGECSNQAAGFVKTATPDDLQRGMMGEAAGAPASRIGIAALASTCAKRHALGACSIMAPGAMRGSAPPPNQRGA